MNLRLALAGQLAGQRIAMVGAQGSRICAAAASLPRPSRCAQLVRCQASKGFGKATKKPKQVEDGPPVPGQREERAKAVKFKGKRQMRQGPQSIPAQQNLAAQPGFNALASPTAEPTEDLVEQIEFEQRLKALKAEAEQKQAEQQRAAASGGGVLDGGREEDIYANVQPLTKSLLSQNDSTANKEYEGSQFGPSQAGLAVAAVLLGAVFLLTSGGPDLSPAPEQPAAALAQRQLGAEQRADLEKQLVVFQEQLAADSSDSEAMEGAAVINAQLGNFAEAEKQLVKLAAAKPGDADVLRVLAESQAAQSKWGPAVGSYRKAWEASSQSSLEILQGLAGALMADGKESAAVEAIKAAQAGGSRIGDTELQLLLGRTYAQWRGHVPDALAVYDGLIESRPDDFRAYLAKGLLLKDQGRAGDAERYFIQAKFFAKEQKPLVDQIIQSRQ